MTASDEDAVRDYYDQLADYAREEAYDDSIIVDGDPECLHEDIDEGVQVGDIQYSGRFLVGEVCRTCGWTRVTGGDSVL